MEEQFELVSAGFERSKVQERGISNSRLRLDHDALLATGTQYALEHDGTVRISGGNAKGANTRIVAFARISMGSQQEVNQVITV